MALSCGSLCPTWWMSYAIGGGVQSGIALAMLLWIVCSSCTYTKYTSIKEAERFIKLSEAPVVKIEGLRPRAAAIIRPGPCKV